MQSFYTTWRKSVRRTWDLPYDSSSDLVYLVANSIPICDEICRRSFNFIEKEAACDGDLINVIVCNELYFCRMKSPLDRNAATYCLHYGIPIEMLWNANLNKAFLHNRFATELTPEVSARAAMLREAMLVRDGCLQLSGSSLIAMMYCCSYDIYLNYIQVMLVSANAFICI